MIKAIVLFSAILLVTGHAAHADVAPSSIVITCDSARQFLRVEYLEGSAADEEALRIDRDLLERRGAGWSEKTVTRTCDGLTSPFVVTLSGLSYNMENANGLCGAVFGAQLKIEHAGLLYFIGKLENNSFCPAVNTPIMRSVTVNMASGQVTIAQTARAGH